MKAKVFAFSALVLALLSFGWLQTTHVAMDDGQPTLADDGGSRPLGDDVEEYTGDAAISFPHPAFENMGRRHYQRPRGCGCGGEMEVNPLFGELFLSTGYTFTHDPIFPLEVTFTYNSGSFLEARNGYGWQMNYNLFYITNSLNENVIVVREDGRTDIFVREDKGAFRPTYGVRDSLAEYEPGRYVLVTKDGTKYWFESADHHYVTRIEDANQNELIFTYSGGKKLTNVTDLCGHELVFEHQDSKLTRIIGPESREISLGHDDHDDLRWICNPLCDTTYFEYDTLCHDLKSITDARGNTRAITWNTNFQVDSIITCCGLETYTYTASGKSNKGESTTVTDANGNPTIYTYDNRNRIVQVGDALGCITKWAWDDNYNKIKEINANGDSTLWTYDSRGNVLTEVNALGDTTWFTWHPIFNKLTSRTDCNDHTTTYEYDAFGNLVLEINALGDSTRYWYNSRSLIDSTMNAMGFVTRYEYNGRNDLVTETNPEGESTFYE